MSTDDEPPTLREIVERLRDADRLIHTGVTRSGKFVEVHLGGAEVCALMPLFAQAAAALLAADARAREAERETGELHERFKGWVDEAEARAAKYSAEADAAEAHLAAARDRIVTLEGRLNAAEPFFRLARETIAPVAGERPWHADSKDWMVVFGFAGQSVTLGELRLAAALAPSANPVPGRGK